MPLTTSFSYGRAGRLYRYYVAGSLDPLRAADERPSRVPAGPLERLVQLTVSQLLHAETDWERTKAVLKRVELQGRSIQLVINPAKLLEPGERLEFAAIYFGARVSPARCLVAGGELRIVVDQRPSFRGGEVSGARVEAQIEVESAVELLKEAHRLLDAHSMSPMEPTRHPCAAAPSWQRQRRVMALGLLAPAIQKAIVQGSFAGSLDGLMNMSPGLAWADQN